MLKLRTLNPIGKQFSTGVKTLPTKHKYQENLLQYGESAKPSTNWINHQFRSFQWSISSAKGRRMNNEDTHCIQGSLGPPLQGCSYMGIFDGHGGLEVSKAASEGILKHLMKSRLLQKLNIQAVSSYSEEKIQMFEYYMVQAFKKAFQDFDEELRSKNVGVNQGCTATVAIVTPSHIFIGNCGDSRAMLLLENGLIHTTKDHKPTTNVEILRIQQAGDYIEDGRIRGRLAVSRALGDFSFKSDKGLELFRQPVSPEPDVYAWSCPVKAMIIACDGLWDVLKPKEIYRIYCMNRSNDVPTWVTTEQLVSLAFSEGSLDNITVLLANFEISTNSQDRTSKNLRSQVIQKKIPIPGKVQMRSNLTVFTKAGIAMRPQKRQKKKPSTGTGNPQQIRNLKQKIRKQQT